MMKSLFTVIAAMLMTFGASAQQTADFFFNYKKSDLTAEHKTQLEELAGSTDLTTAQIKVVAHCDSVGGSEYNVGLGQARADLFVSYFTGKNVPSDNITVVNNGSNNAIAPNDTEENMALNRRVIVTITASGGAEPMAEEAVSDSTESDAAVAAGPCSLDTIIELEDGAKMKISNCQYKKYKDCLTVKTFSTASALKDSKFTTMAKGDILLSTAGIIDVRMCQDANLDSAITIYIPIRSTCKLAESPFLWTSFQNDIWNSRSKKASVETIDGKEYYAYSTRSSGTANFASEIEESNAPEFQIKGKKGLKIKTVKVYYSCELGVYTKTLEKLSKKVKINLPCPSNIIYFTVIGEKKGEEIKLNYIPLGDVKAKKKQKSCAEGTKRKYYFYPPVVEK